MNEAVVTIIDADVGDFARCDGEEDQVARLQLLRADQLAAAEHFLGSAWQGHSGPLESVLNQAAAVEATRVGTAVTVGDAEHFTCGVKSRQTGNLGRIRNGGSRLRLGAGNSRLRWRLRRTGTRCYQ